jgi:hypothetical protein
MKKVRLFADCFKTKYNSRVWINPNFKLDFLPKVVTNLFKTTSTGLVVLNKNVTTFGKKSNLKLGLIQTRQLH